MRYFGFAACLVVYGLVAVNLLFRIMIGDCDQVGRAACEAARSTWLLGLAGTTIAVLAALVWVFFLRGRKR